MYKRRWVVVVAALLVAGVAITAALAAPSHSTKGKTYYFIPKDTLNPYEVIADRAASWPSTSWATSRSSRPEPRTLLLRSSPRSRQRSRRVRPES